MMTWIQNLLGFFYDIVFGCRHWSQTRPFTLEQQTYKVAWIAVSRFITHGSA